MANLFLRLRQLNEAVRESVVGTIIRNVQPTVRTNARTRVEDTDQITAIVVPVVLISIAVICVSVIAVFIWRRKRKRKRGNSTAASEEKDEPEERRATFANEGLSDEKRDYLRELLLFKLSDPSHLEEEFKTLKWGLQYPCLVAMSSTNKEKNKYNGIVPYDHSRVILTYGNGEDYYNASYSDGIGRKKQYIAAQAPMEHTAGDFWKMVYDEKCPTIVMLTNLKENKKIKCSQYWPTESVCTRGNFEIALVNEQVKKTHHVRVMEIQNLKDGQYHGVTQFHYKLWCDHKVPDTSNFVKFWEDVSQRHKSAQITASHNGPMLVHCSAGIGRTGVFICFDRLMQQAATTGELDVFQCLQEMREQRVNMIQTKEQYIFVHQALLKALETTETEGDERRISWNYSSEASVV